MTTYFRTGPYSVFSIQFSVFSEQWSLVTGHWLLITDPCPLLYLTIKITPVSGGPLSTVTLMSIELVSFFGVPSACTFTK